MRKIKSSGEFFALAYRLLRCCLVLVAVWPIGRTNGDTDYNAVRVTPLLNMGSGPVWISESNSMYVVDGDQYTINRYQPGNGEFVSTTVDDHDTLRFLVPVSGPPTTTFVVDHSAKVGVLAWDGKSTQNIKDSSNVNVTVDASKEYVSCAKGDVQGRLWIGVSNVDGGDRRQGKLIMLERGVQDSKVVANIDAPDAITWSPLNTRIYWLNKDARKIYSRSFDSTLGQVSTESEVLVFDFVASNIKGSPSDMTMDSGGNLWVACMDTNYVLKIHPTNGQILLQVDIPGAQSITGVAFGGVNLEDLYVTGTKIGMFRVKDTRSNGLSVNAVKLSQFE